MIVLKEEINRCSTDILNISKWKLIVVGVTAATCLGWSDVHPDRQSGVLLAYAIGFLCAYVDRLYFQRLSILHQIAWYLRNYKGEDPEMIELRTYERAMTEGRVYRKSFRLLSQTWFNFAATILFSLGLPLMAVNAYRAPIDWRFGIVVLAIVCNIVLFKSYRSVRRDLTA